jgi:hypothetical protein
MPLSLETFFAPVNIERVIPESQAEVILTMSKVNTD